VIDRLGLLDLRDHRHVTGEPLRGEHVLGPAHEGQRDIVDPGLDREREIAPVLVGQRRRRQRGSGEVHPLPVLERAADHHPGHDLRSSQLLDLEPKQSVVQQDRIARPDVAGQRLVGGRDPIRGSEHLVGGDCEPRPWDQVDVSTGHPPNPDLGPREIGEYRHRRAGALRLRPNCRKGCAVLAVAVREVEARHVHTGVDGPRTTADPRSLDRWWRRSGSFHRVSQRSDSQRIAACPDRDLRTRRLAAPPSYARLWSPASPGDGLLP
jgi:hypothetical protein